MKTLLLTDMHGRDPARLIRRVVEKEGIEKLAVLGDLDTPKVLKSIRDSVKYWGLDFIYAVGNHEYSFVRHTGLSDDENMVKDIKVPDNGKLKKALFVKSAGEYFDEWDAAPAEKDFVLNVSINRGLDSKKCGLIVSEKEIVYAHASLVEANPANPFYPDFIWARLLKEKEKIKRNFEAMDYLGDFRIFFRGHDHIPSVRSSSDGQSIRYFDGIKGKHQLDFEKARAIVTVGAFIAGHYAVYDSESHEIDFRKLRVEDRTKMKVYNF